MEQVLRLFNPWWERPYRAEGIRRGVYLTQLQARAETRDVVFITGLRRVGKTTLVRQYIERLIVGGTNPKRILYFSMDHPVLARESILDVLDAFRGLHGLRHDDPILTVIDEVHLREGFERELKTVYDLGAVKVYATGSSSLFLVQQGAFLTGRQSFMEIRPFGFAEYLEIKGIKVRKSDAHLMVRHAEEYVLSGGLPEYLQTNDPGYITTLVESVLYKDVAARRGIRNVQVLRELLLVLSQSAGSRLSIRRIGRLVGLSHESVREHLTSLIESNLLHLVRRHGKISESLASPRKIYLTDTGIIHVLSPTVNLGSLVENCVFNDLRTGGDVRYALVGDREVDFVQGDTCFEVRYVDRVVPEDFAHLRRIKARRRVVITRNQKGTLDGLELIPLWRFLMR